METTYPTNILAGPSNEAVSSNTHDDDSRHSSISLQQVPKITSNTSPPSSSSADVKDVKNIGSRFLDDLHENDVPRQSLRSTRSAKGNGKEGVAVQREKKQPLQLLDLPLDILKDIVKEVTHTNDLTSLALCHSALHRLAIPHIYSRFDIVWPDTNTHTEPRSGVDALTYGLATLVMAEEIFQEPQAPSTSSFSNRFNKGAQGRASETRIRRRRGNHYAQYTRKFSLGNGPTDWVQEYLITKEGGKMLGTLVALAVARMRSLETFVWDMPTGILRDVWLALSSLGDRVDHGRDCRLEKLWVRWHDNSTVETMNTIAQMPPPMSLNAVPPVPPHQLPNPASPTPPQIHLSALDRVEHPTFSVLPPLKSLSVLDIDELAYLDEMAVLIGTSKDKLRELRVGVARHAMARDWVTVWEGENVQQVDRNFPTAASLTIGEKRLGGVLGILTGFVCDMREPKVVPPESFTKVPEAETVSRASTIALPLEDPTAAERPTSSGQSADVFGAEAIASLRDSLPEIGTDENVSAPIDTDLPIAETPTTAATASLTVGPTETIDRSAAMSNYGERNRQHMSQEKSKPLDHLKGQQQDANQVLRFENLELERLPLSVPVLERAIDWRILTSLTLLYCGNHEQLWKTLRRTWAPVPKPSGHSQSRRSSQSARRKTGRPLYGGSDLEMVYELNLKKIHTNTVSPALVTFLKETLAPNSLEVLFLQEARNYTSSVTVDAIFRGPLRRHRNSLKKVLIDSSEKGSDGIPTNSSRWRRWMLGREILSFICCGKMPSLRELGMAIDYRDWHYFLQRLPSIPHLRSLYIPFLADHVHGSNLDPRELALQILDIVALRPEVELCYMGVANKCFEILESRRGVDPRSESRQSGGVGGALGHLDGSDDDDDDDDGDGAALDYNVGMGEDDDEDEEDDDDDDDDEDDHDDEDGAGGANGNAAHGAEPDADDTESDFNSVEDSDSEPEGFDGVRNASRLRLREILFYDDKVAIFKARHGRL